MPVYQVKQIVQNAWRDANRLDGCTQGNSPAESEPNVPAIAGVSGGADSMALVHIVSVELGWPVVVAHVNYGLRGEESDADEELVRSWCAKRNIPCEVLHAGSQVTRMQGGNFQDHARGIRMRFYKKLKAQYGAWCTLLAHHRDDQLETIMQKILRGAAPDHWTGMYSVHEDLLRPLLQVDKDTLVQYARLRGIPYREDRSNRSSNYARNLLRNEVFPKFENLFPGWKKNILRLQEFALLHSDLLHSLAIQQPADRFNRTWWLSLPGRVQPALLRYWIDEHVGPLRWSRGMVSQLDHAQQLQTGGRLALPSGFFLTRDRDHFVLTSLRADSEQRPVHICTTELKTEPLLAANLQFRLSAYTPQEHGRTLQLSMHSLPERLVLRRWNHADRFNPLGMQGHQSVADHLAGRKFPAHLKKQVMVLEDEQGIVYALIYPGRLALEEPGTLSERVRCTERGEAVLSIQPVGEAVKPDAGV